MPGRWRRPCPPVCAASGDPKRTRRVPPPGYRNGPSRERADISGWSNGSLVSVHRNQNRTRDGDSVFGASVPRALGSTMCIGSATFTICSPIAVIEHVIIQTHRSERGR